MDPLARTHASMRASWRGFAQRSDGGRLVELEDVQATIFPAAPERSVFNAVLYERAESLERHLNDLAAAYDAANVRAWTVWVPDRDVRAAEMLAAAGHVLDADPANMLLDLRDFHAPPFDFVAWGEGTVAELAEANEAAYPHGDGSMRRGIEAMREFGHIYAAREDGRLLAALATEDFDDDCYVTLVATMPDAQGRGLASGLLGQALLAARARGCTTSTLQATKRGEPVYARLGYHVLGAMQMWERRRA